MSSTTSSSRPWALITGASEGLGKEFAKQIAARQTHNLILAARTESKLNALAQDVSKQVECKVILADLSVSGSAQKLDEQTKDFDVAVLINNAGIATGGSFEDTELEDIQRLLAINIVSLTELFYRFLPRVKEQHKRLAQQQNRSKYGLAGIINLSSMSAFTPIPSMAVYAASKSYVLFLSEAVYQEQRNKGCDVRIVCSLPGPTKTEIWTKEGAHEKSVLIPMGTAEHVCAATLRALDTRDKPLIIPGYLNNLLAFGSIRLTPRSLARFLSYRFMGQDPALRDAEEVKQTFAKMGRKAPTRQT